MVARCWNGNSPKERGHSILPNHLNEQDRGMRTKECSAPHLQVSITPRLLLGGQQCSDDAEYWQGMHDRAVEMSAADSSSASFSVFSVVQLHIRDLLLNLDRRRNLLRGEIQSQCFECFQCLGPLTDKGEVLLPSALQKRFEMASFDSRFPEIRTGFLPVRIQPFEGIDEELFSGVADNKCCESGLIMRVLSYRLNVAFKEVTQSSHERYVILVSD